MKASTKTRSCSIGPGSETRDSTLRRLPDVHEEELSPLLTLLWMWPRPWNRALRERLEAAIEESRP